MDMDEASARALRVRELYSRLEQIKYGREWSLNDILVGMVGDVGDLAQLVGAQQGIRPGPDDIHAALAHELSDVLWSVLVLADILDIDMDQAFPDTMDYLEERVTRKIAEAEEQA